MTADTNGSAMVMNIPFQIEAEWDIRYAALAGFPLNILYSGIRQSGADHAAPRVVTACYWFDLDTYREDPDIREMLYFPRENSPYRVRVTYQKASGTWETFKYRGDDLVCVASGADFARAMMQTTLAGLAPDEPESALAGPRDDTLASVQLGVRIEQLLAIFPSLHQYQLRSGDVLYQLCNNERLELFAFIEEPWSLGYITKVWVRRAEDPSMCRKDSGLPETVMPAVTPRGVKVGDLAARMIERYGHPTRVINREAGMRLAVYELRSPAEAHVDHLTLSFMVDHGRVTGFMLQGDLPGVKRPS